MTSTNFVFLLAIVTLTAFVGFWLWQLRKIRMMKRSGDAEQLKQEVKERY